MKNKLGKLLQVVIILNCKNTVKQHNNTQSVENKQNNTSKFKFYCYLLLTCCSSFCGEEDLINEEM